MKIKSLQIKNFKSIEDLVLIEPNPFSVFVGPNGAGKSNIFEAMEFVRALTDLRPSYVIQSWGGYENILKDSPFSFRIDFPNFSSRIKFLNTVANDKKLQDDIISNDFLSIYHNLLSQIQEPFNIPPQFMYTETNEYKLFFQNSCKVFLNNSIIRGIKVIDAESILAEDGSNMEKILRLILNNAEKKEELVQWLRILIPEFRDIEIRASELSGEASFIMYEKSTSKPFPKHLISDGTKNILAILTAVYQSNEPQFLCIEEPENGLHPYVIEALVGIFRNACKEKGHYIWLNTHSETLVRQLTIDEIIVVDKKNGSTRARQFQGQDLFGLEMDEAWLTNALGGGLP